MTTTDTRDAATQNPSTAPAGTIYVEWGGRRFGPYRTLEEARRYFEIGN